MHETVTEPVREPARITIGTDPSGMPRRPDPKRRGGSPQRPPSAGATPPPSGDRNLPVAVISGVVLAAVFIILSMWRPAGAVAFVTILWAWRRSSTSARSPRRGTARRSPPASRPASRAPLAAYWVGDERAAARDRVRVHGRARSASSARDCDRGRPDAEHGDHDARRRVDRPARFVRRADPALVDVRAPGTPSAPTRCSWSPSASSPTTSARYFVGSAFGRTPLRGWISPNKTIEGLLGGTHLHARGPVRSSGSATSATRGRARRTCCCWPS